MPVEPHYNPATPTTKPPPTKLPPMQPKAQPAARTNICGNIRRIRAMFRKKIRDRLRNSVEG